MGTEMKQKSDNNILLKRFLLSFGVLIFIRLGTFLPVPGIDHGYLSFYNSFYFRFKSRVFSTCDFVLKLLNATIEARALFSRLSEPNCFAITFLMPATSKTVRTEPPAITPEPSIEGLIIILHAPKFPITL